MKRIAWLIAIMMMIAPLAAGASDVPDGALFERGKEVLRLMSYREYDRAFEKAAFTNEGTARDFERFAEENFYDLFNGSVQRDVAALCRSGDRWILYIPVLAPNGPYGEVLCLTSRDGANFDGYGCVDLTEMRAMADGSPQTVWNGPIAGGEIIVESDNP